MSVRRWLGPEDLNCFQPRHDAQGIAIGVINYMAMARAEDGLQGGHAINIIYVDGGKDDHGADIMQPLFFEPQTGGYYNLTAAEFQSIWTVYI